MDDEMLMNLVSDIISHESPTTSNISELRESLTRFANPSELHKRSVKLAISCLEDERMSRELRVNTLSY